MTSRQIKRSYGIILCRHTRGGWQTLMVNKRVSYAFHDFVLKIRDPVSKEYFNSMTEDELLILNTLDFKRIWDKAWIDEEYKKSYKKREEIFLANYMVDGGMYLRYAIRNARVRMHTFWEWPKGGKKKPTETDMGAAVREFAEETKIQKVTYRIIPNIQLNTNYIDSNIKYITTYFLAIMPAGHADARYTIGDVIDQGEIASIEWFNKEQMIISNEIHPRLKRMLKPIWNLLRKGRFERENKH